MRRSDMPRGEFIIRKIAFLFLKILIALLLGYVMYHVVLHTVTNAVNDIAHAATTNQAAHAGTPQR